MQLTPEQLKTLRHMLGINTPEDREPKPHRNYAAVYPGNPEYIELEMIGAIKWYGKQPWPGGLDYYCCTDEGKSAAIKSHRDIRYSRSKRRYIKYLHISDCFSGLTFKEFLTDPMFKDARESA